jgi:hypothetical protein
LKKKIAVQNRMNINNNNNNNMFNANINDNNQIFGIIQQCSECFSRMVDIDIKYQNADLDYTQQVLRNWIDLLVDAYKGQEALQLDPRWMEDFLMIDNQEVDLTDQQKIAIRNSYEQIIGPQINNIQENIQEGGKRRKNRKTRKARKARKSRRAY